MARNIKESSYAPMLQGVSQQVDHERLPGQVQDQLNMLCDPQTGLRRRPGTAFKFAGFHGGAALTHLVATEATIGGVSVHVHVDADEGTIQLYSSTGSLLSTLVTDYVVASDRAMIRFANLNDELFILNTGETVQQVLDTTSVNSSRGFFYIEAGAFNKRYKLDVQVGATTYTAAYTTPDGTGTADAAACTPGAIAASIVTALGVAGLTAAATLTTLGQYVYIAALSGSDVLTVTAEESLIYVVTSNQSRVRQSSQLPARLPAAADGYVMAVGDSKYNTYYKYNAATGAWLEAGQPRGITSLTNTPISITYDGSAYAVDSSAFEGRLAGDDVTNPPHTFMVSGRITGMSAYQGRLVLLSGNMVSMSATNSPRRFFRTTVTGVLDADPIEIGSGNITSANFTYALAFNKDLVLFADRVQAVVPSQNTAITPRTAAVVLTGTYNTDLSAHPVGTGRTVLFPVPRSSNKFGVLELVPSSSTDSQYMALDVTSHLPTLFKGTCRFTAASAVSRLVVFAPSENYKQLVVHEFLWDNDSKAQSAWHTWEFPTDVAYAYFYGSELIVCFTNGTSSVMCGINPRITDYGSGFLDASCRVVLGTGGNPSNIGDVPLALAGLLTGAGLRAVQPSDVGQELAVTEDASKIELPEDVTGEVRIGLAFTSSVVPTRPVRRDYKERPVLTGKATIRTIDVHTVSSGPYSVTVDYTDSYDDEELPQDTLLWESDEFRLGEPPVSAQARNTVPCRVPVQHAYIRISTNSVYELNITQLDYVLSVMSKTTRG